MNESMTLGMWGSVFGRLFLEVSLGVFVVGLAQGWVRSASWRRALWMGTLISSFFWLAIHLTDMEQRAAMVLTPTPTAQRQVVVRADLEPSLALTGRFGKVESEGSGFRPEASTSQIPPVVWPFWLWLTGVVGVGAWRLGGKILLTWAWRRGCWPSEREHAQFVSQLALKLGYRRRVRALESRGVISPIAVGWIRPTVGLPAGFWSLHSAREKEAILAHELAHLSRHDPFWLGFGQ